MSKRNGWQMYDDAHQHPKDIMKDDETVNLICDLYDKGVDLKMIKLVFDDIKKTRLQDFIDDTSALESRDYY